MSSVMTVPVTNGVDDHDEIQLVSNHEENAAPRTQLIELTQFSLLKAYSVHYTLFDGHYLSVYVKHPFLRPRKYWLNLAYLEPTPRRVLKIDKPSLYACGILSLAAMVLMLINTFTNGSTAILQAVVALVCTALIALLLLIYRSKDRLVFYSRYGRVNWLEILINKPNRRAYKEFVQLLISASHAVSSRQSPRHEQRLGAELREHRRLKDEGALPARVYEDVKRRFLGEHVSLMNTYREENGTGSGDNELNSANLKYIAVRLWRRMVAGMATIGERYHKADHAPVSGSQSTQSKQGS